MTIYDGSIEWPRLEQFSDQPTFNTKAVVQQTGVPAPTLRAWERRYTLLMPERAKNAYRLYSDRDVALIRWLKERVDSGLSISHAVTFFRYLETQQQVIQTDRPEIAASSEVYFEIGADQPAAFQIGLNSPHPSIAALENEPEVPFTPTWSAPLVQYAVSAQAYPTVYNMQTARAQIIDIFQDLDEPAAQILLGSLLSLYSVEQVCLELIVPTLWDIGRLWAEGKVTVSVEHFASNFCRAMLTNMFHVTHGPTIGPLILTCCAPGEPHELAILMLSLFLRRSGMRVIYLGQSIETTDLLHTIKKLSPAIVCISLTLPAYIAPLMNLGRMLQTLPGSRPILAFGGQAFLQFPQPEKLVPEGIYMEGDLREIIARLQSFIALSSASK